MSNLTLAIGRPTIIDRIFTRRLALDIVLVIAGVALTALAAQISIPLWPVPITGQTLAVLLVGVTLGAVRAGISLALYAVVGVLGLPVFSQASSGWSVLAGPTGGYIIGFVFAAILTGWLAQREWDRKLPKALLAFFAGSIVPFAFGLPWLAVSLGKLGYANDVNSVLSAGFYPFIVGGIIKAIIGAGLISLAWFLVRRSEARKAAVEE